MGECVPWIDALVKQARSLHKWSAGQSLLEGRAGLGERGRGGCRSPIEADSEIIRAAVLLDELDTANPSMEPRHIVVQVKTMNSLQTLSRVCSSRIMALHTGQINARRFG